MQEYKGKTLDEVLNTIASEKGCEVADIIYTVLEEKKGILGIGSYVLVEAYTKEDIKEFIFEYLGSYFTGLGQGVKVEIYEKDDEYKVNLNTDNNAIVIGKNGQTLRAINTVLRGACNFNFKKRINVSVDINHYKEDRYRRVKQLAKKAALDVRKTKMDITLDPMPNDERRVIHQYLNDFDNIKTESVGEGRNRRLVVKYSEEA